MSLDEMRYTPTTLCSIHFVTAINQKDEPEVKKIRGMQIVALSPTCAFYVRQAGSEFLVIRYLRIEMFPQSFYAASFDT